MDMLKLHLPAQYRIQLQGRLDPDWAYAVGGMEIEVNEHARAGPVTILQGEVADQAALAGVLNLVYTLRLPLISVEWLGDQDEPLAGSLVDAL
jgi:hypothetical protein